MELNPGEPHPSAKKAKEYIFSLGMHKLYKYLESFSAIEGNRVGEICGETLDRLMIGKPVSDRYVLGLAWALKEMEND